MALSCALAMATGAAAAAPRRPAGPLILVPSAVASSGPLVIFYSGDGGWAGADRRIAAGLAQRGLPVVGVDALHYFWRTRSADQAAADLAATIADACRRWGRSRVILAGYSFGAGALPLVAAHLPPDAWARVQMIALIAPGAHGELVLRPRSWFNIPGPQAAPLADALRALSAVRVLCIYAVDDHSAACPRLPPPVALRPLSGGHHFKGQTDAVAAVIARAAGQPLAG